ncbi:unnamed protein product, partial [marine sediment metagenome]
MEHVILQPIVLVRLVTQDLNVMTGCATEYQRMILMSATTLGVVVMVLITVFAIQSCSDRGAEQLAVMEFLGIVLLLAEVMELAIHLRLIFVTAIPVTVDRFL